MQAITLINQAFKLAGILDPAEKQSGEDVSIGLEILNGVLDKWSSIDVNIPTINTITIEVKEGVASYSVSPMVIGFLEGNVLSGDKALSALSYADEFIQNRFNYTDTVGTPSYIFIEDEYDFIDLDTKESSSKITFFPVPDADYTVTSRVKQTLADVKYYDDLKLPPYAKQFLKLEIAIRLCNEYAVKPSVILLEDYKDSQVKFKLANRKDLSVNTDNIFLGPRRYRPWGYYGF